MNYLHRWRIKMKRLSFVAVFFLVSLLYAVNSMPLLTTMTGEFPGAALGWSTCSIDFNGDGIKDLVALERHWNPDGVYNSSFGRFGRILFYWGGTDFDNVIDASINGEYHRQYGSGWIQNVGDVNNDGIEDLCYWGEENQLNKICIFFGRQNPLITPDFVLSMPNTTTTGIQSVFSLGDVNHDLHADMGFLFCNSDYLTASLRVLDGATLTTSILYSIISASPGSSIRGIGDVNNDGIDDYHISSPLNTNDHHTHCWLSVHYGSGSFPISDSLVISPDTNSLIVPFGCPLGDVNGDDIDDFASFINSESVKVWFGSPNLSALWDVAFPSLSYGGEVWGMFVHGDFNNDGYSDIVDSNYMYGLNDGSAYLWMGGSQFNGTMDLAFYAPPGGVGEWYGYCIATGDFNNDGYCDLAVSEPYSPSAPLWSSGNIYIYLGNSQLADTTVGVDDPVSPTTDTTYWDYCIYPNPLDKRNTRITLDFFGEGYREDRDLWVELYNIKGQLLFSGLVETRNIDDGKWEFDLDNLPSGVYLTKISLNHTMINNKRFTIR